jgi:hypothetical protein
MHRASGEDDVVPPASGRDEAVEQETLVVGSLVPHLDHDRLSAVCAHGLDATVDVERRADAECVPGAERGCHPYRGRRVVENERVLRVESRPACADVVGLDAQRASDLVGRRRAPQLDEQVVRGVAQREVVPVDPSSLPERASRP